MQTHLEIEEFKFNEDIDQELGLELSFGNLPPSTGSLTILADQEGRVKDVPVFSYDDV